jgi:transcriptional regulator with XRE-family HTH domain
MTLKKRIARKRGKTSIRDMAREIGISPTSACRLVRGGAPDPKTLGKLMDWFDVKSIVINRDELP